MKKIISIILLLFVYVAFQPVSYAKAAGNTHITKGAKYLTACKYTLAIKEYSAVLKTDNKNSQALNGIVKAYSLRGKQYAEKDKEWGKAANDYRASLFYAQDMSSGTAKDVVSKTEDALDDCYKKLAFRKSAQNRFDIASILYVAEVYPAAAYEYMQASSDKRLKKDCEKKITEIKKILSGTPTKPKTKKSS